MVYQHRMQCLPSRDLTIGQPAEKAFIIQTFWKNLVQLLGTYVQLFKSLLVLTEDIYL